MPSMDHPMPNVQDFERYAISDATCKLNTIPQAAIERMLADAIQHNNTPFLNQLIEAWVCRLSLPSSSPYRLSAIRAVKFADTHAIPALLGPACLMIVMETPQISLTSTTGATVSAFPSIQLNAHQRIRLTLGFCVMETQWVQLRSSPHKAVICSQRCLTSWHHKWADINQARRGSRNVMKRIGDLMDELAKDGSKCLKNVMAGECWNAAVCEVKIVMRDIQAGGPFIRV
jgi:hypothetical protein